MRRNTSLIMLVVLIASSTCLAGFVPPPGGVTTIVDTQFQFKGVTDYIAPPGGNGTYAGGVVNWSPIATEVIMGQNVKIDVQGTHEIAPHGEGQGGVLMLSLNGVVAGGAVPLMMTSLAHGGLGHVDYLQAQLDNIAPGKSRLYVQLDHTNGPAPAPLDPTTFNVPEPTSAGLLGVAAAMVLSRRRRKA